MCHFFQSDFRQTNKSHGNDSLFRSVATSRWTAQVEAQVKRHAFISLPFACLTYRAHVITTPVTIKGGVSSTLFFGNGGGSGTLTNDSAASDALPDDRMHTFSYRVNPILLSYMCDSCVEPRVQICDVRISDNQPCDVVLFR
ncbi:hypothetical protein DPMN_162865 [Dreissena polymorpha]|uniref:Uncharacterized protein n=1 Tax=Dreissena polymorpha TaxID=45954 RepID=A0A9D4EQ56_DREPO|nr:hypothetical protein DPMN_162865 [Dreissena polymorpha]